MIIEIAVGLWSVLTVWCKTNIRINDSVPDMLASTSDVRQSASSSCIE